MKKILLFLLLVAHSYLLSANIIYINQNATSGQNNGTTWENAYLNLEIALANFTLEDTLWLANGTYKPTNTVDRNIKFEIPSGAALYGGFSGNEQDISERDLENNTTVLSGEIGNQQSREDNSFTVAYLEYLEGDSTIIDGIIFERGKAVPDSESCQDCQSDFLNCKGAGLFLTGNDSLMLSNIIIRNCGFRENSSFQGMGLYIDAINGTLNLELDNCIFKQNYAWPVGSTCTVEDIGGGGMYILQGRHDELEGNILIENCHFHHNFGFSSGGGMAYRLVSNKEMAPFFKVSNSIF